MSLIVNLTNEKINKLRPPTGGHQKVVQGSDVLFISVDLSILITVGLAILNEIKVDDALWAQFGNRKELEILEAITSIAFVAPAENVNMFSYLNSGIHSRVLPATEVTALPFTRQWRNYALGGATRVVLDVGVAL